MPQELQATAVRQSINADYRKVLSDRWQNWYGKVLEAALPRGSAQIVGYLPDGVTLGLAKTVPELELQSITVGVFDSNALEMGKAAQAWPSDWVARLPELMGDYRAVLWDTKNKTLIVVPKGAFNSQVPKVALLPNQNYHGEPVMGVVSLGTDDLSSLAKARYTLVTGTLD